MSLFVNFIIGGQFGSLGKKLFDNKFVRLLVLLLSTIYCLTGLTAGLATNLPKVAFIAGIATGVMISFYQPTPEQQQQRSRPDARALSIEDIDPQRILRKRSLINDIMVLAKPLLMLLLFWLSWQEKSWWLMLPAGITITFWAFSTMHQLVHVHLKTVPPKWRDPLLAFYGLLVLYPAHAFKTDHLWHHAHFEEAVTEEEDPEGYACKFKRWQSWLITTAFLSRLVGWSLHHETRANNRHWIIAELVIILVTFTWCLFYPVSFLTTYLACVHGVGGILLAALSSEVDRFDPVTNKVLRQLPVRWVVVGVAWHEAHHMLPALPESRLAEATDIINRHRDNTTLE